MKKALNEANKDLSIEPTNGKNREESVLKFNVNEIEYKCSIMNDGNGDRFIIKKDKDKEPIFTWDASLDTWNKWKEKSKKILNREE